MSIQLPENYSLHVYDSLESTNSFIKENNFVDGSIVLAKSQTAARGKMGTSWVSPIGNLYFSLLMNYCSKDKINTVLHLVFLIAISIREAIGMESIEYKWPNDLMLKGKKFCGILIETLVNKHIIIGVGINIISAPENATSLLACEPSFADKPIDLLKKIIIVFDKNKKRWLNNKEGFTFIQSEWNNHAFKVNEEVLLEHDGSKISGILKGIDEDGALMIKVSDGVKKFYSGSLCIM